MQVTYRDQVPANGVVRNALADTDLAIVPDWGFLTVYGRQEALSGGVLEISLSQGSEEMMIDGAMTINNALSPNRQDDIIVGPVPTVPGKSLRSRIVETAGFATDLNVIYDHVKADMNVVLAALGGAR